MLVLDSWGKLSKVQPENTNTERLRYNSKQSEALREAAKPTQQEPRTVGPGVYPVFLTVASKQVVAAWAT